MVYSVVVNCLTIDGLSSQICRFLSVLVGTHCLNMEVKYYFSNAPPAIQLSSKSSSSVLTGEAGVLARLDDEEYGCLRDHGRCHSTADQLR